MSDVFIGFLTAGVIGLIGAAAAGWLLVERGRLAARLAVEEAARRTSDESLATARADTALHLARAGELAAQAGELSAQVATLTQRIRGQEELRQHTLAEADRQLRDALEAERQSFAREREGLERTFAARERALLDRERDLKTFVDTAETKLREAFGAAAGEQLKSASAAFLTLAQERLGGTLNQGEAALKAQKAEVQGMVKPIAETLAKTDAKLAALELERASAYAAIKTLLEQTQQQGAALQKETGQLVQALREPRVRGYYGEIQLKRVAELAGMRAYCDFVEQDQTTDDAGKRLRPDMVIRLPNDRRIVVDAKANILPFLDALKAQTPEAAEECLVRFADGIAAQAAALGKKTYWSQYDGAAEFVVMFVPGDQFVDAALARRPDLLDTAAGAGVILASPSTLIGMLRAVAVAFREERLTKHAQELLELGQQLHERAATALGHVERLGDTLGRAVGHYNAFVGSYESRLVPALARFSDIGAASAKALPDVEPVTVTVRALSPGAAADA